MNWAGAVQLFWMGLAMALLMGPKWARRLLLANGVLMLAFSAWLTWSCLQQKGLGAVAIVATLRAIVIFAPLALLNGAGIGVGWLAMKLMKVPTDQGVMTWYRQSRWPNRRT